ncbi:hypothetical protein N657DRAFT_649979 [Parathielavia appendiculata]|uniref:DUF7735 domain-containing protein n=1 Tax=Parathielavia appendiculata TaxID=2587402 RepID=A0AAN6YZA3_9PEZI|nr:hypothetical protein N657DRAFT_649979 [Parathielavia appendiculata]
MPASLLPEYTSYPHNASSWWAANGAGIVRIASECLIMRLEASNMGVLGGAVFLNLTLIHAKCCAEANPAVITQSAMGANPYTGTGAAESKATCTSTAQLTPTNAIPQLRW